MTARFEVWRQDDHGNRFFVEAHADRAAAERRASELADRGHKQTYFVVEREGLSDEST